MGQALPASPPSSEHTTPSFTSRTDSSQQCGSTLEHLGLWPSAFPAVLGWHAAGAEAPMKEGRQGPAGKGAVGPPASSERPLDPPLQPLSRLAGSGG